MTNGFRRLVGDAARLGFSAQDAVRNAVDSFNEADHPREGGKFTAGTNAVPSTRSEHAAQSTWHRTQAKALSNRNNPMANAAAVAHRKKALHHEKMSGEAAKQKRLLTERMAVVRNL